MDINQRIEKIINDLYSGNKRAFAIAIGVNPTVIENIVGKRRGNPSFEVLQKVLFANENINPHWLILDKGNMIIESDHVAKDGHYEILLKNYTDLIEKHTILKQKFYELNPDYILNDNQL